MSKIDEFLKSFSSTSHAIEKIAESGSGRTNYRFKTKNDSYVLTHSEDILENESFFYLSNLFENLNGFVPEVLQVSKDKTMYVQDDLGDESLLHLKLSKDSKVSKMYELAVKKLIHLQVGAHQIIDYTKLKGSSSFDKILVLRDLFYFKNYFLDLIELEYEQADLLSEFETIAEAVVKTNYRYFMFRDFQGRNIMVKDNKTYFIDFQDGMEGPIAYDLVSLLWQAKAELTNEEKESLYHIYTSELQKLIPTKFDAADFEKDYKICVLIRLLQVLGAYGKLGIMQQKPHFKDSLSYGIKNLNDVAASGIIDDYPNLKSICLALESTQVPKIKN